MSNVISDELAFALARAPVNAAIAAARFIGRGDERAADEAAVDAMRAALNALSIRGRVVIGEGERDNAPMLYVGEMVGRGKGGEFDIALDPLEGTTLVAKAEPNALSVIAVAPKGGLLHAPDTYMDKIAIGPGYDDGLVDLDEDVAHNVKALAIAKGVPTAEIGVCVLDRPRHAGIIEALRSVGARVHLISDGDIAGVIHCTEPSTGIDMYLGSGGAPEGVLAAAALKCVGGQFQCRLVFRNDEERLRAQHAGIEDLKRRYDLTNLASDETVFIATGVTDGSLLSGVRFSDAAVHSHTLILNAGAGTASRLRMQQPL